MGIDEGEVDRLYEEARAVRDEIEVLWNQAQATDVAVKGAVSAALTDDLSDNERDFAVSFGLQNADTWHKLAELSERLGGLIEDIDRAKKEHEEGVLAGRPTVSWAVVYDRASYRTLVTTDLKLHG